MSRSQPTDNSPNPAKRFFEWNGEIGNLRYYDKEKQERVSVDLPFEFILLDRLSTITGWHNNSESGLYANEIRDTLSETLMVKAFKMKEPIASGFYQDIRDKVKANGGKFTINAYIAYFNGFELSLGSFKMHGAAMSAWIEFENDKSVKPHLYKKGVKIASTVHGEKGTGKKKIEWEAPVFELMDISENDASAAIEHDQVLQAYLKSYFSRSRAKQAETDVEPNDEEVGYTGRVTQHEPDDDEIPF